MSTNLATLIADATLLRVTRVGGLAPLLVVTDAVAISTLRDALAIDPESLAERIALTTPGVLDLQFFRGNNDIRAIVTYVPREFVRWTGWPFDARLSEPQRLTTWLSDHGWSGGAKFV